MIEKAVSSLNRLDQRVERRALDLIKNPEVSSTAAGTFANWANSQQDVNDITSTMSVLLAALKLPKVLATQVDITV